MYFCVPYIHDIFCLLSHTQTALKQIIADIGHEAIGAELLDLWMEYEEGTSLEATLARQLDKFEMIVQANEYELVHTEKRLDSFYNSTANSFSHPEVSFHMYFTSNWK